MKKIIKVIKRHNKKEVGEKKEDSENKILNEGVRDENVKVRGRKM